MLPFLKAVNQECKLFVQNRIIKIRESENHPCETIVTLRKTAQT